VRVGWKEAGEDHRLHRPVTDRGRDGSRLVHVQPEGGFYQVVVLPAALDLTSDLTAERGRAPAFGGSGCWWGPSRGPKCRSRKSWVGRGDVWGRPCQSGGPACWGARRR